jgi:hypothetical protein
MFSNITWTDYIIAVILVLTIYYLSLGIRYYFHEGKNLVRKAKNLFVADHNEPYHSPENNSRGETGSEPGNPAHSQKYSTISDEAFQEVGVVTGRLKGAMEKAWRTEQNREGLLLDLRLILNEKPVLKNPSFRSLINNLIISECARYGSMLSEDEIVSLWNDA